MGRTLKERQGQKLRWAEENESFIDLVITVFLALTSSEE